MCGDHSRAARRARIVLLLFAMLSLPAFASDTPPISLHPENPHYFLWHAKPTVLITSGEHYGALLNLDFDYVQYFEELQKNGLNLTRTFSGTYREFPQSFGITDNTLGPKPSRYLTPWVRSEQPGYTDGGNKFDLNTWDPAYFERLKEYFREAARRGVVVEFTLFCTLYDDDLWKACPMNAENNVNNIGACPRQEVLSLRHDDLTGVQTALVRKLARELKDFDNLIYEVCNEPYMGEGVTDEWQYRIVDTLVDEEKKLGVRHLISMNIANGRAKVENPHPEVSVLNFHYCFPPDTVALNYHLNRIIGENETGFRGREDSLYRTEGWDFILAGGALFNSLDWSFTPAHPKGDLTDYKSPGGGSAELRKQLGILKRFIEACNFTNMQSAAGLVKEISPAFSVQGLAEPGKAYALYIHVPEPGKNGKSDINATLAIELPKGQYAIEWVNPLTGETSPHKPAEHEGGVFHLETPAFGEDIALSIRSL